MTHKKIIGNQSYTAKQSITDDEAACGEQKEELIETYVDMNLGTSIMNCSCECLIQIFKNLWEEKWNPSNQEDEPGILTSGDAVTIIKEKALLHFVAFFHVASLFSTWVDNKKVGVDNEKALELTNSTVFHRGRQ